MAVTFDIILALVSIVGFLSILVRSFSGVDVTVYSEMILLVTIGVGLLLLARVQDLKTLKYDGLTTVHFARIIMIIVASMAVLTGIFNVLPFDKVHNFVGFLAVKGLVSIVAIVAIIISTWVINPKKINDKDRKTISGI
jgi:hypothetical protein